MGLSKRRRCQLTEQPFDKYSELTKEGKQYSSP